MTDLQDRLLKMISWLHNFCVKHEISYYISGGTLLGAVRHKGFIPWDDDIDIAIPRNEYMKIIDLLKKPIDGYVIESPYSENKEFPYSFAKFYDTNTTLTENLRRPFTRGVFIDIFPIDGLGNDLKKANKNYKKIKYKYANYISKVAFFDKKRKWYKNFLIAVNRLIPFKCINLNKMELKLEKLRQKYSYHDSSVVGVLGIASQEKEIMAKEIYGTPTLYKFHNIELYGPEKYHEYLNLKYGDYTKLPPKQKQVIHETNGLNLNKGWK